ncbi:MAG: P-loop NTPase [Gammaproteobacteria bacterium]
MSAVQKSLFNGETTSGPENFTGPMLLIHCKERRKRHLAIDHTERRKRFFLLRDGRIKQFRERRKNSFDIIQRERRKVFSLPENDGPLENKFSRPLQTSSENFECVANVLGGLYKQECNAYADRSFEKVEEENSSHAWRKESGTLTAQNHKNRVIAIGGAKGGIGKSLFAANLAVSLANKGWKTLIIDLDLGAPNLHLYFGETALKRSVNDFINKSVPTIEDLIVKTAYGPYFIGGKTAQIGAANISFAQKFKLIKAIRTLNADYVIFDLGGGTHYNIVDFFLAADLGIVVTTSDPASYLDAYNFIKLSLYRKLNRLFGHESGEIFKDKGLEKLVKAATSPGTADSIKTIGELFEQLERELPFFLPSIKKVVQSYTPNLVMNRINVDTREAHLFNRIQRVAEQMLHLKINCLGAIPYQPEVENSTRDLIPIVAKYPQGDTARRFDAIAENLYLM